MSNSNCIVLIIIFVAFIVVMYHVGYMENFSIFPAYECKEHPMDSNCQCPPNSKQIVIGEQPMSYGTSSPYVYTCVPKTTPEPVVNDPYTAQPQFDNVVFGDQPPQ